MTAIEHRPQSMALAQPSDFSREQIDLIKQTLAPETNDLEFALFMEVARTLNLSPLQRQIHAVMRWDNAAKRKKMVIQTGIDGYRLIAARTGAHLGTTDAVFGPPNKEGYPEWAQVTTKRLVHGHIAEYPATAFWDEYVQVTKDGTPNSMWKGRPRGQLGKCAEALSLRKAFPAELSGVYSDVEMEQADNPTPAPQQAAASRTVDITREVQHEINPNAEALQAWADKIGAVGGKINARGGRERAVAVLAQYPDWRKDTAAAKAAYGALYELGVKIKEEQTEPAPADAPPFDVAPVEELLLSDGQRKGLCAHASRAGAKTSEDRAALWGYSLNSVKPEGTKTLTAEQAHVLLDTFSGLDNSEAEQMLAEARRAFKSAAEAQS